jgi:pimeloyl-ACP methyl ester carboxylesterase
MSYQPRRKPMHDTLSVRGLNHRLHRWGPPSDSPIVLLHGWMDTGDTWQFVVDHLPDSWSLVALDWRGFGGSDWSRSGYWFPDYYADLEVMLDALVPNERARVIGHSMGGNVACVYAGVRTQRLQWLISLEGMGMRRSQAELAPLHYEKWLDQLKQPPAQREYESLDQLIRVIRTRNARLTADRAEFVARAWSRPTATGVELAADPGHRQVSPVKYRREESEACWRRVEIPVLMVLGEHSEHRDMLGADCTEEYFRAMFRYIDVATIPSVGHMMHHEDPEAVARLIVEFARARASV